MSTVFSGVRAALFYILAAASIIVLALLFSNRAAAEDSTQVRWLMSHSPADLYTQATADFAASLAAATDGKLALTAVYPESVGVETRGDVPYATSVELMESGSAELSSVYAVAAGVHDAHIWTLNLPFLFKSYDSLAQTLDGATGRSLLTDLSAKAPYEALEFTLSGGFRIIASREPMTSVDDLKGKRVATSGGPVAEATLTALGAVPVAMDLESGSAVINPSEIDAVETTYSRLSSILGTDSPYLSNILETNHSLFLTMIVADDGFWDSLSAEEQQALRAGAHTAALTERAASVALAKKTKEELRAKGSVITEVPKEAMAETIKGVYDTFIPVFNAESVAAIQAEQN